MLMQLYAALPDVGYIAGTGDGIVTVGGKPAERVVVLLDATSLKIVDSIKSQLTGRYIFMGLNPRKEYLVMARDYKKEYEPFAWDYVKPAIDLTVDEQLALWSSWQTI